MLHVTCIGCNRQFSPAGYTRHLSLTKREQCRSLRGPQRNVYTHTTPIGDAALSSGIGNATQAGSTGTNQSLVDGGTTGVALGTSPSLCLGDNTIDAAVTVSAPGMIALAMLK